MNPIATLPATCELCGNWLPAHSSGCPRNGVHPSQWSICLDDQLDLEELDLSFLYLLDSTDQDVTISLYHNNRQIPKSTY